MKSERVENWWCCFEWCILSTEKLWSSNKFKKMKSLCKRRVSVWNPDTSKEIIRFVHELHLVFCRNPLKFLAHSMWVKWLYHPTFNLFRVHLYFFSFSGSYSSEKLVNAWKATYEVRKVWKLMMWLWKVHFEHTKSLEFK